MILAISALTLAFSVICGPFIILWAVLYERKRTRPMRDISNKLNRDMEEYIRISQETHGI